MPEDPIRRALGALDRPTRPDPAFTDALFERLVKEAHRPPALVPPRSIRGRGRHPEMRRVALIAAVLVTTLAVLFAVLGPLRNLATHPTPGAGISSTSPFRMTMDGSYPTSGDADVPGTFSIRITYQSAGAWRIDVLGGTAPDQPLANDGLWGGGPGSYVLWSRGTLIGFDAASGRFVPQMAHASWFSPLNLLGGVDPRSGWQQACESGTSLGEATIAGRPAQGTRCPAPPPFGSADATVDVWQDVDSHLILKLTSSTEPTGGPTGAPTGHVVANYGHPFPPGPIIWYEGESIQATSVDYNPVFPSDEFSPPPPTSIPTMPPVPVTSLAPGAPLPTFSGTTLDGQAFDLSSLRGKPTVIYVWADWCEPCTGTLLDAVDQMWRSRSDVNVVTVGLQVEPASIRAFVRDHGVEVPVVIPSDEKTLRQAWGLDGVPTLLLLDESGNLVGAYTGWNQEVGTAADLRSVVDALVSGSPLPVGSPAFRSSQTS